jgi:chromosome segregation ATPase
MPYIILICLLALGGGYAYHSVTVSNLESEVVQLEANNRTLKENQIQMENAVKVAQQSLAAAEANAKKSEAAMTELTQRNNQLQREKDNAMKIFRDHNLTRLARAKPGMIEKRANAKTAEVFRKLEDDTKELMDSDDDDAPSGVQLDAQTGVGSKAGNSPTGTTNNNGNGEGTSKDIPTASSL